MNPITPSEPTEEVSITLHFPTHRNREPFPLPNPIEVQYTRRSPHRHARRRPALKKVHTFTSPAHVGHRPFDPHTAFQFRDSNGRVIQIVGVEGTWRAIEGRVNGVHFQAAEVVEIVRVIGVVHKPGVRSLSGAEVARPKGERSGRGVVGGGVVGDGVAVFVGGGGGGHEG